MFNKKAEVEKRFKFLSTENIEMKSFSVLQDKQTGVQYLVTEGMQGVSVTPLLDATGKVLVSPVEIEENKE